MGPLVSKAGTLSRLSHSDKDPPLQEVILTSELSGNCQAPQPAETRKKGVSFSKLSTDFPSVPVADVVT